MTLRARFLTPLKSTLPQSLFGRALLILVLPTLMLQIVAIYIFYERHWSNIERHLSSSLAGEVALIMDRAITTEGELRASYLNRYADIMNMDIQLLPPPLHTTSIQEEKRFAAYMRELRRRLGLQFTVYEIPTREIVRTQILWQNQIIQIDVGVKRLKSSTTYIFISWLLCSAVLLTLIAIIFLRNQIRPIKRLAEVAQRFGMGQDVGDYRPHGAREVRQAGMAFLTMRARLLRQVNTRTAMLSGISHDLRTPLTRMKLQLAFLPPCEETLAMQEDIAEMDMMINEYLEFARGNDEDSPSVVVDIAELVQQVVQAFVSSGAEIEAHLPSPILTAVRPLQLRRAVQNIISNALKYGERCSVTLHQQQGWVHIIVTDAGNGIPEADMEEVFRPFTRLETSRNTATGGVGLGLAITRDIIQAHGGKILLKNNLDVSGTITGLTVTMMLPMAH
jgi:two-component system osmolarity sensor histidine kinase EnvZ